MPKLLDTFAAEPPDLDDVNNQDRHYNPFGTDPPDWDDESPMAELTRERDTLNRNLADAYRKIRQLEDERDEPPDLDFGEHAAININGKIYTRADIMAQGSEIEALRAGLCHAVDAAAALEIKRDALLGQLDGDDSNNIADQLAWLEKHHDGCASKLVNTAADSFERGFKSGLKWKEDNEQ